MYYILCEGEENKSEYKFVKSVVTLYANNKPFSILAAGGYDNLINLIRWKIEMRRLCNIVF